MDSPSCLLAHETNFWLWLHSINQMDREIYLGQPMSNEERDSRVNGLMDWDENFVNPCCFNEINCGRDSKSGFRWKVQMIGGVMPEEDLATVRE